VRRERERAARIKTASRRRPVNICQAIEAIFLIPGPNRKIKRIRGKCFGTRPGLIWCRHTAQNPLSLSFSHLAPQGPHQRSRFGRPVPICILKRARARGKKRLRHQKFGPRPPLESAFFQVHAKSNAKLNIYPPRGRKLSFYAGREQARSCFRGNYCCEIYTEPGVLGLRRIRAETPQGARGARHSVMTTIIIRALCTKHKQRRRDRRRKTALRRNDAGHRCRRTHIHTPSLLPVPLFLTFVGFLLQCCKRTEISLRRSRAWNSRNPTIFWFREMNCALSISVLTLGKIAHLWHSWHFLCVRVCKSSPRCKLLACFTFVAERQFAIIFTQLKQVKKKAQQIAIAIILVVFISKSIATFIG
jgi:hypothetical protein